MQLVKVHVSMKRAKEVRDSTKPPIRKPFGATSPTGSSILPKDNKKENFGSDLRDFCKYRPLSLRTNGIGSLPWLCHNTGLSAG